MSAEKKAVRLRGVYRRTAKSKVFYVLDGGSVGVASVYSCNLDGDRLTAMPQGMSVSNLKQGYDILSAELTAKQFQELKDSLSGKGTKFEECNVEVEQIE